MARGHSERHQARIVNTIVAAAVSLGSDHRGGRRDIKYKAVQGLAGVAGESRIHATAEGERGEVKRMRGVRQVRASEREQKGVIPREAAKLTLQWRAGRMTRTSIP
jgi:hypothetical protein